MTSADAKEKTGSNQPSGCDKSGKDYCGLFDGEASECYYRESDPEKGIACTHPNNLYIPEEDVDDDDESDLDEEDAAYLSC